MALMLIKEDGTGLIDANSYADVADGDAYHDGHLYATAWTAASAENKAKALVMATRVIDAQCEFNGGKSSREQALKWPRYECRDPDANAEDDPFLPDNAVPKGVIDATCEMARELLIADRTAAPAGEGIREWQSSDLSRTVYSKTDTPQILPRLVQEMLSRYAGAMANSSSVVPLVRS